MESSRKILFFDEKRRSVSLKEEEQVFFQGFVVLLPD
jgi:hypothetical protein